MRIALERAGVAPTIEFVPADRVDAAARAAVAAGPDVVVVDGGDGTLRAAARALLGGDVPLGVLPFGTFNHFAKDLGVPLDLDRAAQTIATGRVARVDVGEVNGHTFINNAALATYPTIVAQRDRLRGRYHAPKLLAATTAFVAAIAHPPVLNVELRFDGRARVRDVAPPREQQLLPVASTWIRAPRGPGLWAARPLRDGLGPTRARSRGVRAHDRGRGQRPAAFEEACGERCEIGTDVGAVLATLDGEVVVLASPLDFRCRRAALPVMVSASGRDA